MEALFEQNEVIYLVADWTQENPDISALLDRYQRVGIPLYLYFPANSSQAKVLPQILSKEIMRGLF
jgi:thiol:disulfide interchange protein DsbD